MKAIPIVSSNAENSHHGLEVFFKVFMQFRIRMGMLGKGAALAVLAAVTLAASGQMSVARADPNTLLPGTVVSPLGGGPGVSAGSTLLFSTNVPWAGPRSSGFLISDVYSNSANNPYGGLTFTYQLFLDASSTSGEGTLALSSFAGFTNIDVTYNVNTPGDIFNYANRSQASTDGGSDVNFVYYVEMLPGANSPVVDIDTGATTWFVTTASVIDSIAVPNITTVGPVLTPIPTPEPSTMALMAAGSLGMLGWMRRAKNRKS